MKITWFGEYGEWRRRDQPKSNIFSRVNLAENRRNALLLLDNAIIKKQNVGRFLRGFSFTEKLLRV